MKNYITFNRKRVDNREERIIHFLKKVTKLKLVKKRLNLKRNTICYVFEQGKFHKIGSYILSILCGCEEKIVYDSLLPNGEMTKNPYQCPVSFSDEKEWNDLLTISILPLKNDWEFYELEWILKRWETSLGFFDFDSHWPTPTYPSDLWNQYVEPNLILFYCKLYIDKYNIKKFQNEFFALYQFYKDKTGQKILDFFYNEMKNPSKDNIDIYRKIHTLYHSINKNHLYRIHLFYNNFSVTTKNKFKINLFISQYLSFNCMYICMDYFQQRKTFILSGIQKNYHIYLPFFKKENDIEIEILNINHYFKKNMIWIGKNHVKLIKTPFWNFVYKNWEQIPRNLFTIDMRSIQYGDSQLKIGQSFLSIFPNDWVKKFHQKDFNPMIKIKKNKKN